MISTQSHELERRWIEFARRYNIHAYDARLMPYDGGKMLCVEISTGLVNGLFDRGDKGKAALSACGLEILVPPGNKGVSVKFYLVPASQTFELSYKS